MLNIGTFQGEPLKVEFEHYRVMDELCQGKAKGMPYPECLMRYSKSKHAWQPFMRGGRTIARIYIQKEVAESDIVIKPRQILAEGEAMCSMADNFNYKRGRCIALGRAVALLKRNQSSDLSLA